MKKILTIFSLMLVASVGFGQFVPNGTHIYYNSGNVGIGTPTPSASGSGKVLHLVASGDNFPFLKLERTGGVNKTNRAWETFINSNGSYYIRDASATTGSADPFIIQAGAPTNSLYIASTGDINTTGRINLRTNSSGVGDLISLYADRFGAENMYGFGIESTGGMMYSKAATGYNWYVGKNADNGNSAFMSLKSNGNLGIGTTDNTNPLTIQKVSGGSGCGNSDGTGGVRIKWSTGYGIALDAWDANAPKWGITKFDQNIPTVMMEGRYNSKDIVFNSGGNIGIGTTNPKAKLDVNGDINTTGRINLRTNSSGVGDLLSLYADRLGAEDMYGFGIESTGGIMYSKAATGYNWYVGKNADNGNSSFMSLKSNGNLGIGTTSPDYKLDVIGTIRAQEIIVSTDGSDFVFEDDYKLRTLNEVEKFIKKNKHLPEIAPAKDMQANGAELGTLNTKLLQKIEELTLYTIEQEKKLNAQNKSIEQQSKMLLELKKELDELKTKNN
ncbi:MAG: hypothetical protein GY756_03970 [bacterium]|nr:hypothetical protein [bacterium]